MSEKSETRIVIEFFGEDQLGAARSRLGDIRQSLMRRDPTSEPIAFIETRSPGGDWIRTLDD